MSFLTRHNVASKERVMGCVHVIVHDLFHIPSWVTTFTSRVLRMTEVARLRICRVGIELFGKLTRNVQRSIWLVVTQVTRMRGSSVGELFMMLAPRNVRRNM